MNGERFGPYELRSLLGRGGMGEVHRAVDLRKNRGVVALKRLPAGLAGDADFHRRFLREAELAARLRDPHVIPIHDYGEIDGHPYLDMRLVEGVDVAAHLGQAGPLPAETAVNLVSQVAGALDAAHREGLVHRDVKPQNMLLDRSTSDDERGPGFVYLIDFGIAANVMSSRLSSSVVTGTCAYMAPERFSVSGGDHRVDVYALGCVLYELLTGRLPFTGDFAQLMHAHTYTTPPPPSRWAPHLPAGLDEVVAVALSKPPDQRYAATGALAAAARRALASSPGGPSPDTQPGRTTPAGTVPAAGGPTARDPNPPTPRPVPAPVRMAAPHAAPHAAPQSAPMPATLRATTADPPPAGAAPDAARPGRRRGWLVAAGVVVAAVLLGAASLLLTRTSDAPTPSGPAASGPEASSTEAAATPTGPTSQQNLTVTGSASGSLSEATMQCPTEGGTMWSLSGLLDGRKLDLNVTFSQGAPGAGTHPLDTGLDPGHAIAAADLDGGSFATDSGGVNGGSFVVDAGARTGSLEAELAGATGNLHVSGSWSCTSG